MFIAHLFLACICVFPYLAFTLPYLLFTYFFAGEEDALNHTQTTAKAPIASNAPKKKNKIEEATTEDGTTGKDIVGFLGLFGILVRLNGSAGLHYSGFVVPRQYLASANTVSYFYIPNTLKSLITQMTLLIKLLEWSSCNPFHW